MKVTIRGYSDDLVEVEGDLREEFCGDQVTLVFGDGTLLEVSYGNDGCWHISRSKEGSATFTETFKAVDPDSDQYSDVATLEGDLVSVDKVRSHSEMAEALQDASWYSLEANHISEVFTLAKKYGAI